MKSLNAGKYRHRITIQRKVEIRDPVTGYRDWVWSDLVANVPAEWKAGPGREYLASESLRSEVQGRFLTRWSPDLAAVRASDRALWDGQVYDIKSDPLTDETARREVTLMVARGVNDG